MIDVLSAVVAFIVAIGILVSVHEYGHFWWRADWDSRCCDSPWGSASPCCAGAAARRVTPPTPPARRSSRRAPNTGFRASRWADTSSCWTSARGPSPRRSGIWRSIGVRSPSASPCWWRVRGSIFVFAVLAYWALFVSGVPGTKAIVGSVMSGSVAAQAGLMPDDEILTVGRRSAPTWDTAVLAILDELLRDGRIDLTVQNDRGVSRVVGTRRARTGGRTHRTRSALDGARIRTGAPAAPGHG